MPGKGEVAAREAGLSSRTARETGLSARAARLSQEASQLRAHASDASAFFRNAVETLGSPNPSLLEQFELLVNVVRSTDQWPTDAEFPVDGAAGTIVLGANGRPRKLETAKETATERPRKEEALLLDGLDSTQALPISRFIEALTARRINRSAFDSFLGAPERMKEDWDIGKLRSFYATRGSMKWISPIDDFIKIDRALASWPSAAKTRSSILRAMADAGQMGFCPTQYLRRVILPRIGKAPDRPESFERGISALAECFRYLRDELGSSGDGSASNLFTLKTLIRPLAAPGSRLFDLRLYEDPTVPRVEEIVFTITRRWAKLFREGGPRIRDVLRNYGDLFLAGIARIEHPRAILSRSLRLLDHVEKLCALIASRADYAAFNKAAYLAGTAILLRRAEGSAAYGTFLNALLAHFDAVEELAPPKGPRRRPFGHEYGRYIACFARGVFKSQEDIRAYVESSGELSSRPVSDSDDLLEAIMRYAREPSERALLLDFARRCEVFDKAIFLRWRVLGEAEREAVITYLNEATWRYLVEPDYVPVGKVAGLEGLDLETAIVKALAQASSLTKREVETTLAAHARDALPSIPGAFMRPGRLSLAEKGYEEDASRARNLDVAFLRSHLALAQAAADQASDEAGRADEARRLRDSALIALDSLRAMERAESAIAERGGAGREGSAAARKAAGLREQAGLLEAFAEFLDGLDEAGGAVALRDDPALLEGALYALAGDKAFLKAEREAFARFALANSLAPSPGRLSEEPWSTLLGADPLAEGFAFPEIAALSAAFSEGAARAADGYFHGSFQALTPALRAGIRRLFARRLPALAEAGPEALADRAARNLASALGAERLVKEIAAIEKASRAGSREILLVGAKRRLEHFFGHIGELCIARCTGEILRKDFIPVRMVDLRAKRVVGYVHVLLLDPPRGRHNPLLVVGIEPKSSWAMSFDAQELYKGVVAWLESVAREFGSPALLMTMQAVAHSNYPPLAAKIAAAVQGKPLYNGEGDPPSFPQGSWQVLPAAPLWIAPRKR